ncbi:MAG: rhomboid family intramembrane serine protease [Anaerolineae bacterium]|jgi:membrane associated rhomboid family serine protease|nr:rhomboid family intramembrane serine protease [Anaerolineae bacterium]
MFPLKANRPISHTPWMTWGLIALNIVVFLWQTTLSSAEITSLYFRSGFVPCQVQSNFLNPSWFTSMFIHGSVMHIFSNMLFLIAFGPAVEDYLGKRLYLVFYLAAGLGSGLMHLIFSLGNCTPAIGASGAIYGVMGGFMLLYPGTKISAILVLPPSKHDVQALYLVGVFIVFDLLQGLGALVPFDPTQLSSVAVWGHIGGFIVGFLMAFLAMTFKPLPPVDIIGVD